MNSKREGDLSLDKYKIDDVAKECGLTKRTIRYYEEIGVLFPPERSDGGTRLYSREHIDRLKQIVNARDVLGFSLQEIQNFLAVSDGLDSQKQQYRELEDQAMKREKLLEIERMVDDQLELIDQKLRKMNEFRAEVEEFKQRVQAGIKKMTP